jgi:hypothetical protein
MSSSSGTVPCQVILPFDDGNSDTKRSRLSTEPGKRWEAGRMQS